MRVLPYGDRALLVEVDGADAVAGIRRALEASPLPGQRELVPAARTVLVVLDRPPTDLDAAALHRLPVVDVEPAGAAPLVDVPVVFDGPDLADVARLSGVPDVVAALTGVELTVAFGGFAPGFGYLTGLPRGAARAPPGDAAHPGAGRCRGAGRARTPASTRAPRPAAGSWSAAPTPSSSTSTATRRPCWCRVPGCGSARWADVLTVLAPGPLTTVQDLGRPGHAAIGVTRSGAADATAAALANRLVGNRPEAALLEVTAGGLRVRAGRTVLVAVTGAPVPVEIDGRAAPFAAPTTLRAGSVLALGAPPAGAAQLPRGARRRRRPPGARLAQHRHAVRPRSTAAGRRARRCRSATSRARSRSSTSRPCGPRRTGRCSGCCPARAATGWTTHAWAALTTQEWRVGSDSDRVGLRLTGPRLGRARDGELPSEGLVPGAVQVPPDGAPVLFLADHPVTGGYPVLAVVVTADLPLAAQLRPGDALRFRAVR